MRQLTSLVFLCLFSLRLLEMNVCAAFAEAPNTPKIIFGTARDGNRELYFMNPDGSEQVNITNHRADDVSGTWSPTGEQILFASDRDRKEDWDLYLMDADGHNVRPIFEKSAARSTPTWSPDGTHIAYTRTVGGCGTSTLPQVMGKAKSKWRLVVLLLGPRMAAKSPTSSA